MEAKKVRIPFIPKVEDLDELEVGESRFAYIAASRGGSAFLLAGSAFWLLGAFVSVVAPASRVDWLLYAGFAVPVLGFAIARLQGARLSSHPSYAALAVLATMTELAALPTMFFLRAEHPEVLPGILMIADGAHLLILMWLHMDYTYFVAGYAKAMLGTLFLLGVLWPESYVLQMSASGLISLVAAVLVWRDSSRTAQLYLKT
ncbi:DUF7010 family protein [Gaiella sp.]|uniref:DUF7010 family protein n=1 Tax=Gaiella sp. TaxID=2663207 RepID=UPI00398373B9